MTFEKQEGYPYIDRETLDDEMAGFVDGDGRIGESPDYVLYSIDKASGKQKFVAWCETDLCGKLAEALDLEVLDIGGPGEDEEAYERQAERCDIDVEGLAPATDSGYDWTATPIAFAVLRSDGDVAAFLSTEEAAEAAVRIDGSLRAVRISDIVAKSEEK